MKKSLLLPILFLLLQAKAQEGNLDPTFGTGGFVRLGVSYDATAFQSDGKLIGAQKITGGFTLTRYKTDGTLDEIFGKGGTVITQIPYLTTPLSVLIAVQPNNDNIVVHVKGSSSYSTPYAPNYITMALVRLTKNGELDASFGSGGIVPVNIQLPEGTIYYEAVPHIRFLAVKPNGIIVTAGTYGLYRQSYAGITHYNNDGTTGNPIRIQPDTYTTVTAMAMGKTGEIAVGVTAQSAYPLPSYTFTSQLLWLDRGTVLDVPGQNGAFGNLAVQNDGKVLVLAPGGIIRYNTDGSVDPGFVNEGNEVPGFDIRILLIQDNGKIIEGGTLNSDFALARYNTDGTLDKSFGTNGKSISDFGGNDAITNMGLAANRLYVYGSSDVDNSRKGILAAYRINVTSLCTTPPTLRNDLTIVLDASCTGNDGLISLIPTSGTAPFMYSINGGATYVDGPAAGYSFMNMAPGTYQLRLKDAGGCESAIITREVRKFYGGPLFRNDGTIVLDASCGANDGNISIIPTCGAAPFQYSIDGGVTYVEGPATGYTFQNLAPGTYRLRLKDFYGTESAIVTREVRKDYYGPCATVATARPAARGAQAKEGVATLQAYPNPSQGRFQMQLGRINAPRVQLQVVDAKGTVLQQRTLNGEQTSVVEVDLSGKAKGLYLIRVLSDKGTQQTKVLIQ